MTKVKVYSTPTCPICRALKEYLKENKVDFENVDVASDTKLAQEMIEKSGQMSVPVVEIDGTMIVGFDQEKIKEALKL